MKPEVPFFARFLESQETQPTHDDVKAEGGQARGFPIVTMKYPSDSDEVVITV